MSNPLFLFEFGSTSLKFHFRSSGAGPFRKFKIPWTIAHEVCERGSISPGAIDRAIFDIRFILAGHCPGLDPGLILAFATGVFREAGNILDFLFQIWVRTGLKVRVISGDQEAALLKALFLRRNPPAGSFAFDLGSGSLQWVSVVSPEGSERGSLPIGVAHLLRKATDGEGRFLDEYADYLVGESLRGIPRPTTGESSGTGGMVKTVCQILGDRSFRRVSLEGLIAGAMLTGPPERLKPHRKPLFIPGLILLRRLMEDLRIEEIHYEDLPVGEALLAKAHRICDQEIAPRPSGIWNKVHFSEVLPP